MAERTVIQEFLARLGFEVNGPSFRAFMTTLSTSKGGALALGGAIVGVGVAAEGMAAIFARSMEKIYYASGRTKTSALNLQALDFGAEQIGINAETARASLEGMAKAVRVNPALLNFARNLGVKTQGVEGAEMMLDLVERLGQRFKGPFGHGIGSSIAEMFGMDEQTFYMLKERLPELRAAMQKRRDMSKDAGLDDEAAAAAGREYAQTLRELWTQIGVIGKRVGVELLGVFRELNAELKELMTGFLKWLGSDEGRSQISATVIHFKALGDVVMETMRMIDSVRGGRFAEANEHDKKAFDTMLYMLGLGAPPEKIRKLLDAAGKGAGNLSFPAQQGFPTGALPPEFESLSGDQLDNLDFLYRELLSGKWNAVNRQKLVSEMNAVLGSGFPSGSPWAVKLGQGNALGMERTDVAGDRSIVLNANTEITVMGTADPVETARQTGRAQSRVFADALRNTETVTR